MSAFPGCGSDMKKCLEERNALQKTFIDESRLSIPITYINEGLHGGAPSGTIFPMPISQAMSWNKSLVRAIATAVGTEANAIGVDAVFASDPSPTPFQLSQPYTSHLLCITCRTRRPAHLPLPVGLQCLAGCWMVCSREQSLKRTGAPGSFTHGRMRIFRGGWADRNLAGTGCEHDARPPVRKTPGGLWGGPSPHVGDGP
jgi:hypothetical protein